MAWHSGVFGVSVCCACKVFVLVCLCVFVHVCIRVCVVSYKHLKGKFTAKPFMISVSVSEAHRHTHIIKKKKFKPLTRILQQIRPARLSTDDRTRTHTHTQTHTYTHTHTRTHMHLKHVLGGKAARLSADDRRVGFR